MPFQCVAREESISVLTLNGSDCKLHGLINVLFFGFEYLNRNVVIGRSGGPGIGNDVQ